MHRYSSVAAFLAHYQALTKIPAPARSEDDRKRLDAIEKLLEILRPEERTAVISESDDAPIVRHRQRAAMRLRRELTSRGALDA